MTNESSNLSPKKRVLFSLILIALPVIFLILLEGLLRLFGYGDDYPLVKEQTLYHKPKYVVNRQVARRYFNLPPEIIPEASEESFDRVKKPGALRIFCPGGSTTAGFPYEINATFPFQLQYRLRNALMDHHVEVINLGISAVNSFTVLDILPEVLQLQPDALIIYMGHNEFYGALGVGSTQSFFRNRQLILLYLKLKRFRVMQLLESLFREIAGIFSSQPTTARLSLMQAMVGKQMIRKDSEAFRYACRTFEANLREIVKRARKHHVAVVLSTLVSNLKDQPPFMSRFSDELDPYTRKRCQAKLLKARKLQMEGKHEAALAIFSRLNRIDSSSADLHYFRAKSLLAIDDSSEALREFKKARDLDLLRFRAPDIFNKIIRRVARETNVPVVDMEEVFQKTSPGGIPGANLFYEHLHPRFDGYRLMAQAFFETLKKIQIINPPRPIEFQEHLLNPDDINTIRKEYMKETGGVTPLDLEFGNLRIYYLTHHWPFAEAPVNLKFYQPVGNQLTREIAYRHLRKKIFWDGAHYKVAEFYEKQNNLEKALQEYQAVYIAFYENYFPAFKIGDLYFLQENFTYALRWYRRALTNDPLNPLILAKLGNVTVLTRRYKAAVKYLRQSLEIDSRQKRLSAPQKATALYLLSVSYANLQQFSKAMDTVNKALALKPDFPQARELKAKLRQHLH